MNKQYYPLNHNFYHNPFGARKPIPHEHDKNDKVRVDCFDFSAGYLEEKISACNGIAIVKEFDEDFNSRLILSSTRGEDTTYNAGYGIDSNDLLDGYITVSGFENYPTKDEVSANYAPYKSWKMTDYDLSLLYNSAKKYYDLTYNIVSTHSGEWSNYYAPGISIAEELSSVNSRVESIEKKEGYWNDTCDVVKTYSSQWINELKNNYVPLDVYYKTIDMLQHEIEKSYKLIDELSGKIN